jgi:hypothetical protein
MGAVVAVSPILGYVLMILLLDELEGKALDWMYERALAGNYCGMKCEEGQIFIQINDDYHPPGWYFYKSHINDAEDVYYAKWYIRRVVGEGPFVVPTDLCVQKYAHKQHEKVDNGWSAKQRVQFLFPESTKGTVDKNSIV